MRQEDAAGAAHTLLLAYGLLGSAYLGLALVSQPQLLLLVAPLLGGLLGGAIFDAAGPAGVFLAGSGAAAVGALVLLLAQLRGVFDGSAVHLERTNIPNEHSIQ